MKIKLRKYFVAAWFFLFTISANSAEKIYFFHNDHLGTPQEVTDIDQNVVWQVGDSPFGADAPVIEQIENNIRFPGQYYDAESGLHYNWNRYYDPGVGRYVTSDPIGLDGGLNTYGYVGGNPIARIDPTGEAFFIVALPFVGGSGATAAGSGTLAGLGTTVLGGLGFAAMMSIPGDTSISDTEPKQCEDEPDKCEKVLSAWELANLGLDAHEIKGELNLPGSGSRYDLCGCTSGRIAVKRRKCQGPIIEYVY